MSKDPNKIKKKAASKNWEDAKSKIRGEDADSNKKPKEEMESIGVIENPKYDPEFAKKFKSSKDLANKPPNYELVALTGKSFSGKTRLALSVARVVKELDTLKQDMAESDANVLYKLLDSNIIPAVTPIYVLGTEESTAGELYGRSSANYYESFDIKFIELAKFDGSTYDYIGTYNEFLAALQYFVESKVTGTIVIDSMSPILQAMHYIMRTKIMKISPMAREQGVPARYWFWRNQQMESAMLCLRHLAMHKIVTYKMAKGYQADEDSEVEYKIRWHEDTNYHLSNTRIDMEIGKLGNQFIAKFDKCRNKPMLFNKEFKNLNASKMFLEIYK